MSGKFEIPSDAVYTSEDDTEEGEYDHSGPAVTLRGRSVEGRDVRGTWMDCACGDDAEDGSEDERNEEEDGEERSEGDGEEQEKGEERRKGNEPAEDEAKIVFLVLKNLFQPVSNKLSNCRAQPIAEILEGCNDLSSKETAGVRCFFEDWLCFDDSEEQDCTEWEQDKQREADDVSK